MSTTTKRLPLTRRQAEVLEFMRAHHRKVGVPPTVKEIQDRFAMASPNGPMYHLKALVRKGFVRQIGKYNSHGYVPASSPGACPCCGRPLVEEGAQS